MVLGVYCFNLVVPEVVNPIAIRRLESVVEEDLSLGDKKIIKDVALGTLYWMLDFCCTKEGSSIYNINKCLRVEHNEMALSRLESYGFKIKSPRIVSFDTSGNIL